MEKKKNYKETTFVYEDHRNSWLNQPCPLCGVNHDYNLRGRVIECVCSAKLREHPDKKHTLVRVG